MSTNSKIVNYGDAIYKSMALILKKNKKSILIGQGINDFKGIWGTTIDFHKKYKNRCIDTPLSEETIAGVACGLSLNGFYPINSHIRVDFSLLAFNQIINLAAKYKYMFGGLFEVPMMFRLVIGRSWGQGAQHSQSLQSLFAHIPGLKVIMPSNSQDLINSYLHCALFYKGPVISLEHRLLYDLKFKVKNLLPKNITTKVVKIGNDLTIITCSIYVIESLRIAKFLKKKFNLNIEIIDIFSFSHIKESVIIKSANKTGNVIVVDTSWSKFGLASEVSKILISNNCILKNPLIYHGMADSPCPTSKNLEDIFYPNSIDIINSILKIYKIGLVNIKKIDNISTRDFYKKFKGPF